jgi:undecaprenyl-diphosphatase
MSIVEAVVLGVIQGITEFFPISSSGHLVIFQGLFGIKEPRIAFDIFLHLGTLVSILLFFYKDILALFNKERKTLLFLVIASVPTFIIALLFKDAVENAFGAPRFVGFMLLVTGIWLFISSALSFYYGKKGSRKELGFISSIMIGIAQGIAILPGISRSGATIGAGLAAGLEKEKAFRFAFLLAIPAILGASVFKARDITASLTGSEMVYFAAGGLAAMLTGLAAIKMLLNIIRRDRLYIFGIYCLIAGACVVFFYKG